MTQSDPFVPVTAESNLHPHFKALASHRLHSPAREMIREIFRDFVDRDGNFVEQFQTTGFDARIWELFLFAFLKERGIDFDWSYEQPDFIFKANGIEACIEAVTVNPTQGKAVTKSGDVQHEMDHEIPIKLGSALYSKLKKEYWKLPQVSGKPLILAIEDFHEKGSLLHGSASLWRYLYGVGGYFEVDDHGDLKYVEQALEEHRHEEKVIPSGFFSLPGAEYVSAVLFGNTGTVAKFNRMGYLAGFGEANSIRMIRFGVRYDHDHGLLPIKFFHEVGAPGTPYETWGEGLSLCHNPSAYHPLPKDFLGVAYQFVEDGDLQSFCPDFFPMGSLTVVSNRRKSSKGPKVEAVQRTEFDSFQPARAPMIEHIIHEKEWYVDRTENILGIVTFDVADKDWGYAILGRDERGQFRGIDTEISLQTQGEARELLIAQMIKKHDSGQIVFPQGD